MKVSCKTVRGILFRMWSRLDGKNPAQKYATDEPPLRSELLSANQMEQHGKVLASTHLLMPEHHRDLLLTRLSDNGILLLEVHDLLTMDVKEKRRIAPSGDWLLDNFYLIEEQIRTAKRHLPNGYSRELPRFHRPGCLECMISRWKRSHMAMGGWIRKISAVS